MRLALHSLVYLKSRLAAYRKKILAVSKIRSLYGELNCQIIVVRLSFRYYVKRCARDRSREQQFYSIQLKSVIDQNRRKPTDFVGT